VRAGFRIPRDSFTVAFPARPDEFQAKLRRIVDERTQGSGGTWGICDLLDSPSKVKKRHAATVRRFKEFQERIRTKKTRKERELAKAFGDYELLLETAPRPS
jgi:hypothetical protein